jgi:hypothetical protein
MQTLQTRAKETSSGYSLPQAGEPEVRLGLLKRDLEDRLESMREINPAVKVSHHDRGNGLRHEED